MDDGLAENIALLHLLNKEPGRRIKPGIPEAVNCDAQQPSRVLTLQHEQLIAEYLVFLAAYTDDPSRVIALCVEETPARDGMIVRTAINSGGQESLQQGLRTIVAALEVSARQGAHSDGQAAFTVADTFTRYSVIG